MRLTIDGRFLLQDVTGVQKVAIELVRALDVLLADGEYPGLDVELLVPTDGDLVTAPDYKAVRLRRAGLFTGHAWEQLDLPRLVGPDPLLCLGNLAPIPLLVGAPGRVHTMVHDLSYKYFPDAYSLPFRLVYNAVIPAVLARSRHVFTVSETESSAIRRRYPRLIGADRLTAVQNGGGEGAAEAVPSSSPASLEAGAKEVPTRAIRDRRCLYVGSLTRRKNADGLARAAIELVRSADMDVVFVGAGGSSFEATGLSIPPDVAERIHLLGQVNQPEVIEAEYRRASVFLFPSFYEASPLPPIEAMRFGCPVVAADIPSLRERCRDAALYCDPGDVDSIVGQVRRVTADGELWDRCQSAGLATAGRYSWEAQARSVLDALRITPRPAP